MADLAITAVRIVQFGDTYEAILDEDTATANKFALRWDTTNGDATPAKATTAAEGRFVGLSTTVNAKVGTPVTIAGPGCLVDVGNVLTGMAYDVEVFLSDTDGLLADGAGTESIVVGRVTPRPRSDMGAPDKLLRIAAAT